MRRATFGTASVASARRTHLICDKAIAHQGRSLAVYNASANEVIDLASIPDQHMRDFERVRVTYDLGTFTRDLSFLWVGVAFLASVGWGAGLLGLGVITLGAQTVRKCLKLPVKSFWLVVGVVFFVWGCEWCSWW